MNPRPVNRLSSIFIMLAVLLATSVVLAESPERNAYFGDTHIHTMYSFDAFSFNVRTTPDDAYRYAKGEAIDHPWGDTLRLSGPPLDFLMVSDHARYMGVFAAQLDPEAPHYGHPDAAGIADKGLSLDTVIRRMLVLSREKPAFMGPEVAEYAWQKIIDAAERHNDPGRFTTFIGYEYTPGVGGRHLHRNVMFRGNQVPKRPFSSNDSSDPEDLWNWMDRLREEGMESLAIPHNMNQSDGLAFQEVTFKGDPLTRTYAEKRMRNEPVAEISQQKGTSETHPSLSPNDEWADFQIVQYYLNRDENKDPISVFKGGYYRDALKTGLKMQSAEGFNPYQLGAIGASDTHLSGAPFEEDRYFTGGPNTAVTRGSAYPDHEDPNASWEDFWTPRQATHGTGGLAGVWADENTREAIYDAMRRRETFATSGPRIRVRLFAGDLPAGIVVSADPVAAGYAHGVPMGGELDASALGSSESPRFLIWAARDPNEGWLQRAQIIKGWVEEGEAKEAVIDVACADGLSPDPTTNRCPDNGAAVNVDDCSISRNKGAVTLMTAWTDPDFDPEQHAFYYVRVLENPSCRWSTWDAIRLGIEPNPDLPVTHQERAWSSPIWYQP
jgi:hypothetical protein